MGYVNTILSPVRSTKLYPRPKFQILPPFKNTPLENPTNDIALTETESMTQLLCTRMFLYFPISLSGIIQFNSIQFIQLISKHIGDNILYIYMICLFFNKEKV